MATTALTLIKSSMRMIGILAQGAEPSSDELSENIQTLNRLLASFDSLPDLDFFMSSTTTSTASDANNYIELAADTLWVESAYSTVSSQNYPLRKISISAYLEIPFKDLAGVPLEYAVTTDIEGSASVPRRMYLFPKPTTSTITYAYRRRITLISASGDDVDFPATGMDFLACRLAVKLAFENGQQEYLQMLHQELNTAAKLFLPTAALDPVASVDTEPQAQDVRGVGGSKYGSI